MRSLGTDEEIRIEVDGRVGATSAIHADRNSRSISLAQIAIHPQRDGHVIFSREKDLAHWHGLQWLIGDLAKYRRSVEPNFRAIRRRVSRALRCAVVANDVVQRRHQVRVAESFD